MSIQSVLIIISLLTCTRRTPLPIDDAQWEAVLRGATDAQKRMLECLHWYWCRTIRKHGGPDKDEEKWPALYACL